MVFKLKGNDVIKEQDIEVTESLIGIYGYNNSGKTTILKELDKVIDEENIKCIVNDGEYIRSLFIPTNRVIVRQAHTSSTQIKDIEEFLAYKKDSYNEFDLHLRLIRENLLRNNAVRQVVKNAIIYMFGEDYEFDFDRRQSDGVENIINIYCSIIWLFTWDKDIETSVYKGYKRDKIEMRVDRVEVSDFPLYLNTVAGGLDRRDQTIGGFSFVVKIYAVPVVEIIG